MNRIARASDSNSAEFKKAFLKLEKFSNKYVNEMIKKGLYSKEYPWQIDSLHDWSRWWEYVFTWLWIRPLLSRRKSLYILDVGSALTFWPLFLVSQGASVTIIDVDRQMAIWGRQALKKLEILNPEEKGRVYYLTADVVNLPLRSRLFDVITNISVIEHVKKKHQAVKEIHRVLKNKGLLINTLDISLDGKPVGDSYPLEADETNLFFTCLEDAFGDRLQIGFTHPRDILTISNHPKWATSGLVPVSLRHRWRQLCKFLGPRLGIFKVIKLAVDPQRLDIFTVMGIAVRKNI